MTRGLPYVLSMAAACQFCVTAYAFQGPEGPLQIMPKALPRMEAAPNPEPMLRINSSLVLVPVHVITNSGASVTGLKKEDFELFEDGQPQTITHFSQGDAPVSAGLLLDVSSSMKNKMAKVAEAATEFFKFANADDEFFLVEFNGRAKLKVPFTREWSQITE